MTPTLRNSSVAAEVAIAALAAGVTAYSPSRAGVLSFFEHRSDKSDAAAPTNEVLNPAPALAPMQAPNYRAIVRQWGPAVVGITVEGTHRTNLDESLGLDPGDDPFFQFFRGLPGL